MRVPVPSVVGLVALFVLPACASTSLASTPTPATVATTTTVPKTTTTTSTTTTTTTLPPTTTTTTTTVPVTTTTTTTVPLPVADPPIVGVGTSDGEETRRAQQRLLELGFWLAAADGDYELTTSQAVMAFQKYHGLTTDGVLGDETAMMLTAATARPTARADAGTLVEIDKGLQLLYFVVDGRVEWALNTSTGSEIPYKEPDQNSPGEFQEGDSVTRNGLHEVYRQREEGWWEGDLGEIYRLKYFTGGIAVHGSNHIPDYPASHGCVRVSVPAMDWIWDVGIMPLEIPVWVHEGIPA
jgi:peptidoglycan hydrolase-like protein with peptidoglycan-binding domain